MTIRDLILAAGIAAGATAASLGAASAQGMGVDTPGMRRDGPPAAERGTDDIDHSAHHGADDSPMPGGRDGMPGRRPGGGMTMDTMADDADPGCGMQDGMMYGGTGRSRMGYGGGGDGMGRGGMRSGGMMGHGMMGAGMSGCGMMGSGMMGSRMTGQGMAGCGMMGQGMRGHGMMGGGMMGRGMGGGMMGQGTMGQGMMGRGMMGQGATGAMDQRPSGMSGLFGARVRPVTKLSVDDVRGYLDLRIGRMGNKRLKVGDVAVVEADDTIVADIVTVDNSLVQRLGVDRVSGDIDYRD